MKTPKFMRWTVLLAAREFNIARETLAKRLRAESIEPGKDGMFSTAQIVTAIYGNYDFERTRLMRSDANQAEMKEAQLRKELISTADAFLSFSGVCFQVKRSFGLLPNLAHALEGKSAEEIRQTLQTEVDVLLQQITSAKPGELLKE